MIKLDGNVIIVDVKAAMAEGTDKSRKKINEMALKYTVDTANSLYDMMRFNGKISYVNKPKKLSMEEASGSMSLSEFKEINKSADEAEAFIDSLKRATTLMINDDLSIKTVAQRQYPELTDEEFRVVMNQARNIWCWDYEWVQNIAQLIELAVDLKKVNK